MKYKTTAALAGLLLPALLGNQVQAQEGNAREPIGPSPYEVVSLWHKPFAEEGYAFGGASGVWAESADRIILAQRGETVLPYPIPDDFLGFAGDMGLNVLTDTNRRVWRNCLYTLNADGEVIDLWDHLDYLCEGSDGPGPHRLRISPYDPQKKLWLVNETFNQIYVIANDGSEVLATYGEKGVSGDDETHFGRPQDVAFLPDGRILVADGLDNNRIIVFDNDMNYITEFGSYGTGPGGTDTIHAVAIGPGNRIFVLDRAGGGVNIWRYSNDPMEYTFERRIGDLTLPLDIIVNQNDFWITDLGPLRFVNYDFEGNLKYTWLVPRELPDGYIEVHTFSIDPEGNLYGGDNQYGRLQKWVPKPGSGPELLIERPWSAR
ncbi:MAG: 6-bladed beta-propeller [Gammaproteobacteria bacterium]|nr:6-bladed beta-propeller [Pseudomonadales bacterium]MCP5348080.1 6-bladed beta-propeller [Pseudomonadales bacterium]